MASIDSLPPDQRAVLQLVLQRGRTYDEIAELLSIDRAGVRERALAAFDALGPRTRVPAQRRSLIADYLLGQLPSPASEHTRERLAESAGERAWARVVASELAQIASAPLPEIPVEAVGERDREAERAAGAPASAAQEARAARRDDGPSERQRTPRPQRPSSRRGGAVVLVAGAVIAVIVVVILLVSGGSSKKRTVSSTPTTSAKPATTGTGTTTTKTRVVAQINLVPPNASSKAAGIAQVLKQGNTTGIVIVAQGVAANSKHDAYAVWLFNPTGTSRLLGFVNPGVGSNGRLQTAGGLPTNAGTFKQLLVTLETQSNPKAPGKIVLQGQLQGVS